MDREVSKELAQEFESEFLKYRQEREAAESLVLESKRFLLLAELEAARSYLLECKYKVESLMSDPDSYDPDVFFDGVKVDKDWIDKKKAEIDALDRSEEDKKLMREKLNGAEELVEDLMDEPPFREDVYDKLKYYLNEAQTAYNRFESLKEQIKEQETGLYPCKD